MKALYAGTFDPPHRGHIDLIQRSLTIAPKLVVAVAINHKKQATFSEGERVDLLQRCVGSDARVEVRPFRGLVADFVREQQITCIVRGVRSFADFEAESSMALANRALLADHPVETVLLLPAAELAHISSTRVKEITAFGGDCRSFLPESIADDVLAGLK